MSNSRKTLTRSATTGDAELRALAARYAHNSAPNKMTQKTDNRIPEVRVTLTGDKSGNVMGVLQFRDVSPENFVAYAQTLRNSADALATFGKKQ